MDNPSYRQGFTRRELLVALGIGFTLLSLYVIHQANPGSRGIYRSKAKAAAITARDIHQLLMDWAADHDGEFPTARQFSNEAFRELFKARLVDTEKLFAIPGDPWHKNSPSGDGRGPDNDIGTAPDYAQALTLGECAFTYVTGLGIASRSDLPLIANGFTESPGVYTASKSHKGGIFRGERCAYVTVGGSARVGDLNSDFRLLEKKDSKMVDVFSKEWGTNPDNIKNPEG